MAGQMQPERAHYRLIIIRRAASEILLSKHLSACSLPSLDVLVRSRVAEQLVAGTREKCRLETCCLWTGNLSSSSQEPHSSRYAVMEVVRHEDDAPPDASWVSLAAVIANCALQPTEQLMVSRWLDSLDPHVAQRETEPFARPGWIEELFRWVQNQIEPLDLRPTGTFQQLNAGQAFSLMRIDTTGAAVWFKATGRPNQNELGISVALDRLFPGRVPRTLGVHRMWNAWLSEEIAGSTLDDCAQLEAWAGAVKALAELQIASVTKTDVLLECGCRDLRPDQLSLQIGPFLARAGELMAMQSEQPPQILTESEIGVLGDRLSDALGELHDYGIPSALGHLDPNPRNIIISPRRYVFLDWAEGSVTHPLFTFEYLCEHARRTFPQSPTVRETLVANYLQPWQSFSPANALAQAMSVSPLLAVFACAVNTNVCSPEAVRNPALAGYFRSLARRAYREAEKLAARSDRCLA